jgi:hypothetical protein
VPMLVQSALGEHVLPLPRTQSLLSGGEGGMSSGACVVLRGPKEALQGWLEGIIGSAQPHTQLTLTDAALGPQAGAILAGHVDSK